MAIFLITAPSGAGKTTIVKDLEKMGVWKEAISHTTRPMRDGEEEGVTYYFTPKKHFDKMHDDGEFAEMVTYNGNSYGISHEEIETTQERSNHVAIILENDGYNQVKELYPDAIGIFLYMSKEDCLANMLLRGDSIENAMSRINTYDNEMLNRIDYNYVIENVRDKKTETLGIIRNIVNQYSEKPILQYGLIKE